MFDFLLLSSLFASLVDLKFDLAIKKKQPKNAKKLVGELN